MKLPKGLSIVDIGDLSVAKLYDTNIVSIDKLRQTIKLNSGGWETKHTKKCMNLVLDKYELHVIQKKFQWYVYKSNVIVGQFVDGMLSIQL